MKHPVWSVVYVLVMVALIVGVDVAFLRDRDQTLLRLIVNIGIVVVFIAGYYLFLR